MTLHRRNFLTTSAATAADLLLPATTIAQRASRTTTRAPQIRVLLAERNGSPLEKSRAATLIARDLANDPLPQRIIRAEGRARIDLADEPLQVAARLDVPGFGKVYCW